MLKLFISSILPLAIFALAAASPLSPPAEKKLIRFGWGDLTADRLLRDIGTLENNSPFDGVGIVLQGQVTGTGEKISPRNIFGEATPWKYDYFQADVQKLKQVNFRTFKHNFLCANIRPGGVDWNNDRAWEIIASNFGILARIARETGCVGIEIDPEHYAHDASPQFAYDPLKGQSFDALWGKARQRGRQIGEAISREFPQAKILAFFWLSYTIECSEAINSFSALKHHHKGLYCAFINGLYDASGDLTFLEGFEEHGYRAKNPEDYKNITSLFYERLPRLLTPENRKKYFTSTQLALPLYMDAYFTAPQSSSWNIAPEIPLANVSQRLKLLSENLRIAYETTNEYIWIWEEFGTWWPREQMNVRGRPIIYWEQHAPGITQLMRDMKNPRLAANEKVDREKLPNLLNNGNFESKENIASTPVASDHRPSRISGWSFWSSDKNEKGAFLTGKGKGRNDSQALCASDFGKTITLSQTVPVKPGEHYLVRGYVRAADNGAGQVRIFWQREPGRWLWEAGTPIVTISAEPGEDGWVRFLQFVSIPQNVQKMGIILDVMPQRPGQDKVYFDDFGVYKLD